MLKDIQLLSAARYAISGIDRRSWISVEVAIPEREQTP
jgi:hypothetical protein